MDRVRLRAQAPHRQRRGDLHRPRRLQADQRHARPRGRRRGAEAPSRAAVGARCGRGHRGAARRRRVRGAAGRHDRGAHRRVVADRIARRRSRAARVRRPRARDRARASASRSRPAARSTPTRSCATPTSRCTSPSTAASAASASMTPPDVSTMSSNLSRQNQTHHPFTATKELPSTANMPATAIVAPPISPGSGTASSVFWGSPPTCSASPTGPAGCSTPTPRGRPTWATRAAGLANLTLLELVSIATTAKRRAGWCAYPATRPAPARPRSSRSRTATRRADGTYRWLRWTGVSDEREAAALRGRHRRHRAPVAPAGDPARARVRALVRALPGGARRRSLRAAQPADRRPGQRRDGAARAADPHARRGRRARAAGDVPAGRRGVRADRGDRPLGALAGRAARGAAARRRGQRERRLDEQPGLPDRRRARARDVGRGPACWSSRSPRPP